MMRDDVDAKADTRYIYLTEKRPARTVPIDEGTVVDLDEHGTLIGIELMCAHSEWDWTASLERILAVYDVPAGDVQRLRAMASAR